MTSKYLKLLTPAAPVLVYCLFVKSALADVWLCDDTLSGRKTFTSAPVASEHIECRPDATARASFLKLADEDFDRWGTPRADLAREDPGTETRRERRPQHKRMKKAGALSVRFSAREIDPSTKKAAKRGLQSMCEIQGVASGEQGGMAIITITRGALTVDTVKVSVPDDGQDVQWSKVLKGPCRKPAVEIEPK